MAGLSAALAPNNPRTRTRTRMRHASLVPVVVRSLRALPKKKKTSFRDRNNRKSRCCEVKRRSRTRAEDLLELLERESEKELEDRKKMLVQERERCAEELNQVAKELDEVYRDTFGGNEMKKVARGADLITARGFKLLGRDDPEAMAAVLELLRERDGGRAWKDLQERGHDLRLRERRVSERLEDIEAELSPRFAEGEVGAEDGEVSGTDTSVNICLVCGFESFNLSLYRGVARDLRRRTEGRVNLSVFSDRDVDNNAGEVEEALAGSDVFFGSLLFDYDVVQWLRERVDPVPTRFVFESDLDLMALTRVGTFTMAPPKDGKKAGPPPAVKKILELFGSNREEDRVAGYLTMLKFGPKLLRYLPGKKVKHLRNWLEVYGYWNQAGATNVLSMFSLIVNEYAGLAGADSKLKTDEVTEMPNQGCVHPNARGMVFKDPASYLEWYEREGPLRSTGAPRVALLLYRKHVITNMSYIPALISEMEDGGLVPVPIFINGVEAHTVVRDLLTTAREQDKTTLKKGAVQVDAIVSTIGFPLVGGPAGSVEAGRQQEIGAEILSSKNVPYVVAAPLLIQDIESWEATGMTGLQSIVLYALPELDGAIDTVPIGGLVGDDIFLVKERVKRLVGRLRGWIDLATKPRDEVNLAVMLYGFPPGVGATGTAALLNVPKSLEGLLKRLKGDGYDVGDLPGNVDGEGILTALRALEDARAGAAHLVGAAEEAAAAVGAEVVREEVSPSELSRWLSFPEHWGPTEWGPLPYLPDSKILLDRLEQQWGQLGSPGQLGATPDGKYACLGLRFGKVTVGVQPMLGIEGDPMRLLFERDLTPAPYYCAYYKALEFSWDINAVIHFGTHGTVEWLPGSPVGNTGLSWPDVLLGNLPNVYVYTANNPSESVVAKRRGYGTIVSHNVPPYGRSGLYKELLSLRDLLNEYREDRAEGAALREPIEELVKATGLYSECPLEREGEVLGFDVWVQELVSYLDVVENRLFSEGLHVFGQVPTDAQVEAYLQAYGGEAAEAAEISHLLRRSDEELDGVARALRGEYVLPAPGGDLLRDGPGVLPTGRNIHALDPYRMPSETAEVRGAAAASKILDAHRRQGSGFPETCSVALWGLDAIKTGGDSVGIVLALVGARTIRDSTGRVARFELISLDELGRPRCDVVANVSALFRDQFKNVLELLDDLMLRASRADEPVEMNFVKKHTEELEREGVDRASSRMFSNPSGDYGSMVNERVGSGNWDEGGELGDTWVSRNAFSYGKGGEAGNARPEVLKALLETTDRVVQGVDSVEYGLTDIQEYYANTGALMRAAEDARRRRGREGKVGCSIVEYFGGEGSEPKEIEDVLKLEYRSKLLNPKWAEAMVSQGSGGAFEVSQRMTALLGWGATANFSENFVWDQAVETYVEDAEMADRLRRSNPEAFRNVLRRSIEAARRGMWDADEDKLEMLMELYREMDDKLEGVE